MENLQDERNDELLIKLSSATKDAAIKMAGSRNKLQKVCRRFIEEYAMAPIPLEGTPAMQIAESFAPVEGARPRRVNDLASAEAIDPHSLTTGEEVQDSMTGHLLSDEG